MLGGVSHQEARRLLQDFTMAGVAKNIIRPTLITHGAKDTLMSVDGAKRLVDEITAKDKTLKITTTRMTAAKFIAATTNGRIMCRICWTGWRRGYKEVGYKNIPIVLNPSLSSSPHLCSSRGAGEDEGAGFGRTGTFKRIDVLNFLNGLNDLNAF